MRGDQIAFESATGKGLNLKPFAHQLRVLLIFKLRSMCPISLFLFFEFQVLFHSSMSRVVVSFFPFRFSFRVFSDYFVYFCATTEYKPES